MSLSLADRQAILALLHQEVVPALGCTEPIAVALTAARAAEALGRKPERLDVAVSANLLKNGMGVMVPGTGEMGLAIAAAAGALGGKSALGLECLASLDPAQAEAARAMVAADAVELHLPDNDLLLYCLVTAHADGHSAAAELRDSQEKLEQERKQKEQAWREGESDVKMVVDEDVIAQVISQSTGIPVFKLTQAESKKLLGMESELHKRIIGQDEAVSALSRSIRRTRVGLKDPKRPSGSFIFAGPTGVGKTELAKALAEFLFDDEDALIRVDMSEFSEKYAASRLFGAPPGYVGYEEGGELTEKVRRKPFSVVLFDEIEKAHPDIFNTLLQVLDDGHLTDGQGRKVDFKNTIIILTTNLGSSNIAKSANTGFSLGSNTESSYQRMKDQVSTELKQQFRPEFLNRLDDIIVFRQLTEPQVRQIVDLDVNKLNDRLFDRHMSLELTDAAKDLLAQKGFDPLLGARPLRRVIQRDIEDAISEKILLGELEDGQRVVVDAEGEGILGEFTFRGERFEEPELVGAASAAENTAEAEQPTE